MNKIFNRILSFDKEALRAFGLLPSGVKIFLYRLAGARIGRRVSIPAGTYLIAESMEIGDDTIFGRRSSFTAVELRIGRYARFEDDVLWRCRNISVGDGFYCSAGSKVGWGGEFDQEASLSIGDSCFIGEEAMLNPSRMIKIGNNSALGAGVKVYTHQFWQSVLDGYEAKFMPVNIGEDVMIGCNAAVLPGSQIGSGSTVAANSTVAGIVKERSLVGGIPAVELPSSRIYPRRLDDGARHKILSAIFAEFLAKKAKEAGRYVYSFDASAPLPEGRLVLLAYHSELEGDGRLTVFNCSKKTVTGLQDKLSDELREFLRKRGIKFAPYLWRYGQRRA